MAQRNVRIINQMSSVPRQDWDALVGGESPFLEWDWLASLEESGCVTAERGWGPHHILVEEGEKLVAACPLYVKGHSEGEFVFDYQWAHAAQGAGLPYYPKMLVAVPFTPAAGVRFLIAPGVARRETVQLMGEALKKICDQNQLSSVHVNFCHPEEVAALAPLGFLERQGIQYQWENKGYGDFEDYLGEFRSKRRTKIRRERREMTDLGIEIRTRSGEEISDDLVPTMYRLYQEHINRLYWGRLYLNQDFFALLASRFKRNLCFVTAENGRGVIAGTVNIQKNGVFYGRYWGAFQEVKHLHFNVCYYAAIEHCIARHIARFEPGAGGDFKQLRGFDPKPTFSLHYFSHPGLHQAVQEYLEHERRQTGQTITALNAQSQLKSTREG